MGRKKSYDIDIFDKSNIRYYYGIANYDTVYSNGSLTPIEAYEYAYKVGLNFMFITDHNSYLSEDIYLRENSYSKFQASKIFSARIRKKYTDFIPLVGFKCTSSSYGDLNIINSNSFFSSNITDLKVLTLWMLNNIDAFITLNKANKNMKLLPYNEVINKIITSVEVSSKNIENKTIDSDKYYFNLLDAGWMLGAVNKENNNTFNLGTSESLTACLCNTLSTKNIISSFRERRTYSTESRYLKFYFTINDSLMGEEAFLSSPNIRFMIFAEDTKYKIKEIQIISNNGLIIKNIENINLNSIKYLYQHKKENNETWYIVKIIEDDNKIAYSSPIFIKENK